MNIWNPWHGCIKFSDGCKNCYVYRRDESIGKDASIINKTTSFTLPLKINRQKEYSLKDGETVYLCMTSDFFIEEADLWRKEIWEIIEKRNKVNFIIITKRIHRFLQCIPKNWGEGYKNVTIICTIENQKECDIRMPIFLSLPIQNKEIICEPLLEKINIEKYLSTQIKCLTVGGESGYNARLCDYEWILFLREQCIRKNISFHFKQTGSFFKKGKKIYKIERKFQQIQAQKSGIDV